MRGRHYWICNTGIFPADYVTVSLEQFILKPDGSEQILDIAGPSPEAIYFPKEESMLSRKFASNALSLIKQDKLFLRIKIKYKYKLIGKEYSTVRTVHVKKDITGQADYAFFSVHGKSFWT